MATSPPPPPIPTGSQPPAGQQPPAPAANQPPAPRSQSGGPGGHLVNQRPQQQSLSDLDVDRVAAAVVARIPAARSAPPPLPPASVTSTPTSKSGWKMVRDVLCVLVLLLVGIYFGRLVISEFDSLDTSSVGVSIPKALPMDETPSSLVITPSQGVQIQGQQQRQVVFPDKPQDFTVTRINKHTGEREVLGNNMSQTEVSKYQAKGQEWKWSKEANYFDPSGNKMPGPR